MNKPFWFHLLHSWCFEKHLTGLTLPFIVGADARHRNSPPIPSDVRRLLTEIEAYESKGSILVLRWCSFRRTYVFGLINSPGGTLQIADPELPRDRLLREIANSSELLVSKALFSRTGNPADWAEFTKDDLDFINAVIDKTEQL